MNKLRRATFVSRYVGLAAIASFVGMIIPSSTAHAGPHLVNARVSNEVPGTGGPMGEAGAEPAAYVCADGFFCWYPIVGGQGIGQGWRPRYCGERRNIGLEGFGDDMESAWNLSRYQVWVYNWTGVYWELIYRAPRGSKGDLPAYARNRADMIEANCF